MKPVETSFIKSVVFRMEETLNRIKSCLDLLSGEELWERPNENANSVGNLILHLNGNIGQYILSGLGGSADLRNRPEEFNPQRRMKKSELWNEHRSVLEKAIDILRNLDQEALLRERSVQGFSMNGIEIAIHVTEHYSYHCGQIALLTKIFRNADLGFYKDHDLNKLND